MFNKKQKIRYYKKLGKLYLIIFIFIFLIFVYKKILSPNNLNLKSLSYTMPENQNVTNPTFSSVLADLKHLNSPYAILIDFTSDKVIAEYNSQKRIYPASLTKIMTAILVIENMPNLNETIKIPSEFFSSLYSQNASMAGFLPEEEAITKDLLYGLLLPSGAECCLTFANLIADSEDAFADLMNQKAKQLNMKNTHFCNSTGLHERDHYSTVEDISILLKYALKNETFRMIFTTSRYSTHPSNSHPEGFTFYSTMFKYIDTAKVTKGKILGGKTGYTDKAGLCLASLACVDNKEYILVTAGADGTHQTEQFHILDAIDVYSQIGNLKK